MTALPPLLTLMRELIALPSVSSANPRFDQPNREVIDRLANWLDDLGFAIEIHPVAGSAGKANLIARLGEGNNGLVLSGHSDTVPYDDGRWQYDPFGGKVADDRFYGLGSADMKSFLALAIDTVRDLDRRDLKQPLTIIATADEECTMAGARALAADGQPLGRCVLIGEPTEMQPIRMHKGIGMYAIRLTGRSGHSSDPSLGNSALDGMSAVLNEILNWRNELQQRYRNPAFAVAVPTVNLGHIHGGDNPNRICGHCELHIDIRPLPGMPLAELRGELQDRVQKLTADKGLELTIDNLFSGIEAMETPADAELVAVTERLSGREAGSVAFATEAPFMQSLGMETVILGPGSIDQAHQPDEYLDLAAVAPMQHLLKQLIGHYCLTAAD